MPSSPQRYAFLLSANGLFAQCAWLNRALLSHVELACVITDRPCVAYDFFKQHTSVPTYCVNFTDFTNRSDFDQALVDTLQAESIDFVMVNFDRLLGPSVLEAFPQKLFNIHSALLPMFPGFGAMKHAFTHSTPFAGSTIHHIDAGIDTGEILTQCVFEKDNTHGYTQFVTTHIHHTCTLTLNFLASIAANPHETHSLKRPHPAGLMFSPALTLDPNTLIYPDILP